MTGSSQRIRDLAVALLVATTLLLVAVVACLILAWRAAGADPVIALRAD
jgi:ABC-type antimicrobial peptide transport system permease subunit